jgi:protein ImuB
VRTADGPERIFGTWWNAAAEAGETRDYFRVENERGERYWMFRKTRPGDEARWYVHGVFA